MFLPLRAISVFGVVARQGSITRAADMLNVTPSAVSQQVQALEAHLGTALIVKVGRRIALTESGERYFEMIIDGLDRIEDATNFIRGYRSVSTLTVRASPSLAAKWLRPRLASFLDANPTIEIRLDGTSETTNFAREAVDIEIRHGDGRWPGLYVEPFATELFIPACAPACCSAASIDAPAVIDYRLIHSIKSQMQWEKWFAVAQFEPAARWKKLLFDRSHMAIDAAVDGLGIALESNVMIWQELRSGALVCPVRNPPRIPMTTQWIVCPYDRLKQHKVKLFLDWLTAERRLWRDEVDAS